MEEISHKQLIGLPVVTVGGILIGEVMELIIDLNTQSIVQYLVKPKNPIEKLFKEPKLINQNQVLSISKEKMVVEDMVVGAPEEALSAYGS